MEMDRKMKESVTKMMTFCAAMVEDVTAQELADDIKFKQYNVYIKTYYALKKILTD